MEQITLAVPFNERESVKALGARWDQSIKRWVVPNGIAPEPFAQWLPKLQTLSLSQCNVPLLLASAQACWKCQQTTMVYSLAATRIHDESQNKIKRGLFTLFFVRKLPPALATLLSEKALTYSYDYSSLLNEQYWINHCHCGAKIDDNVLHKKRGGAFSPRDEQHCTAIHAILLTNTVDIDLSADYHQKKILQRYAKEHWKIPENV